MGEETIFHRIIKELCIEMKIKMEKLSCDWVLQLSQNGKVRHITDHCFDNNPQATGMIVADKYATYQVLKSQEIPVVKHTILFNPATRSKYIGEQGLWNTVVSEFSKQEKLVVKPNNGNEGIGIELCYSLREVEVAIQKLFNQHHQSISICPYYNIKAEYRTFYLNGEILLIYKKRKPFVVGDGKTTLKNLVEAVPLPKKEVVQENLKRLDLTSIPKEGEKVELSWKHNLSGGATPIILEKGELYDQIEKLAIQAGKAMNINFSTIDIIQTVESHFYVMEMNSGVCGDIFAEVLEDGYEMIKDIYRKALKAMF